MKAKANLNSRFLGLACTAFWLALQFPCARLCSLSELRDSLESPSFASAPSARMSLTSEPRSTTKETSLAMYGELPLSFEANCGQANPQAKFLSRGRSYQLFLTSNEAVMQLRTPANLPSNSPKHKSIETTSRASAVRMKLVGTNAGRIMGLDELPGKSNYFVGNDPKKWRTNVPTYSRVKYEGIYHGVDLVFYGNQLQLEYDLISAPGASLKAIRIAFDGAERIRIDDSGDLLIDTSVGEIRQRKPVIYQQLDGVKQQVNGGYAILGKQEVGFEVGDYDPRRPLVIDPVIVYSASIGGSYNESANAIAVDAAGNAYIAGMTTSLDFPTVNPVQPKLRLPAVYIGIPPDAFVAKLNPSGTALLYSTYLGGTSNDAANAIAVDAGGNAYATGYSRSNDFPTTPEAFQTKASTGGDVFVTKLNSAGDSLIYSTRLGGDGTPFGVAANVGLGIAVDAESSAYVTGYTFSSSFPVKRAAQGEFNRANPISCCFECFYGAFFSANIVEDAFVTKLNRSGTDLVYSTYVGGIGREEGNSIAVDSFGEAYVTGWTCSRDFASGGYGGGRSDAFLVKLSSSGRRFVYSKLIGGSGDDIANSVTVDSSSNAYLAGQTESNDFPATEHGFQTGLGGSPLYKTDDGGKNWTAATGLSNRTLNALAIDPVDPSTMYAGLGDCTHGGGIFKSTDGGQNWRASGLLNNVIRAIAVDPKSPSTVYADRYKSTDGGNTWNQMAIPASGFVNLLVIDPITTSTIYIPNDGGGCGDGIPPPLFLKSTDGGTSWNSVRISTNTFSADSFVLDPTNPSTLYAGAGLNLYKSTDRGSTWRVVYQTSSGIRLLSIDPVQTSVLYAMTASVPPYKLIKSTDGGVSFTEIGSIDVPANAPISAVVIDTTNGSTLYAATSGFGNGGELFKSTDGGLSWGRTDLSGMSLNVLMFARANESQVYAGAYSDVDGFVTKVDTTGGSLIYSTYLGSRGRDMAASIGIDAAGSVYVTGGTYSNHFPTRDALHEIKPNGPFQTAAFITKVGPSGSTAVYSTYLGSDEPSLGSGIAVTADGKAYVAGTTGVFRSIPTAMSTESVHGGLDALVVKIASPPRITGASVSGKNLIVTGEGFDKGAVLLIDGVEQRTRHDLSSPPTILIGKKSAKSIGPGQRVSIQVRSSDGMLSEPFEFVRPVQ